MAHMCTKLPEMSLKSPEGGVVLTPRGFPQQRRGPSVVIPHVKSLATASCVNRNGGGQSSSCPSIPQQNGSPLWRSAQKVWSCETSDVNGPAGTVASPK